MMDLATTEDAELHNALRLMLMEWCVRYGIARSDLQDTLDDLMGGMFVPWPIEVREGPEGELYEALSQAGIGYAQLSGRTWKNYVPNNPKERALLDRAAHDWGRKLILSQERRE